MWVVCFGFGSGYPGLFGSLSLDLLCRICIAAPPIDCRFFCDRLHLHFLEFASPTKKSRVFVLLVLLRLPNRRHQTLFLLLDRRSWKKIIYGSSVFSISLNLESHNSVDFGLQVKKMTKRFRFFKFLGVEEIVQ